MHQYLTLFLAHATLAYSLNCFHKIWQCAFIFVLLVLLTNFIAFAIALKKLSKRSFSQHSLLLL
jgi:hypothetical protein